MKMNKALNILIVLLIFALGTFFFIDRYQRAEFARQAELSELEAAENRIATDENAINLVDATEASFEDENEVFLSYESFLKGSVRTSHYVGETSVSYRFSRTLTSGGSNIYILNFKMRAENEAAQIDVKFGKEHTYYLTTQWRDYYLPCTKGQIDSIKITLTTPFQKIYLSDLRVLQYDPLLIDYHYMKNGSYSVDGIPSYAFAESDGIGAGKTMDVTGDGEYLYSAGGEMLKISRIEQDGTSLVSTLYGIGNIRHIELRDSEHLAVASRETGVYIVNIKDKENPYIESYYDSLEIANDVCFAGDYMIVAGRYFGVEIVDISDITNPVYVTRIVNDKECFRCVVDDNYLYVSCWSTGDVEIYDISTINNPVLVSSINVTGKCGEVFIEDDIAYIVSGYSDFVNADDVGDAGYGTGNALAIYDVTDVKRPVWQSTIKTEGMLYGNGYDDWSVQVSNGYAYFTNSFGGLYIYDVWDTKNPVSVAHIAVELLPTSSNYVDFSRNERTVFPYDIKKKIYSPAMGLYIGDGKLYFACAYNDVYEFAFEGAKFAYRQANEGKYKSAEVKSTSSSDRFTRALTEYDVYSIENCDGSYVIATGEGLLVADNNLSVLGKYSTKMPVKDVSFTPAGAIVTAETDGVGVYKLDGAQLVRVGFLNSAVSNRNVSAIGITGDGSYAVVQSSWTKFELVDLRDINNPTLVTTVISKNGTPISVNSVANAGNMYYRNIVSGSFNGAVGIGGSASMIWFESKSDGLHIMNSYSNVFASEIGGSAVLSDGENILTVYNNGFYVYNPSDATEASLAKSERHYVSGVRIKGKVSIKDDVMVVCNAPNGVVQVVNIKNLSSPYLMATHTVEYSTGISLIEEDRALVPLRHGGIMKIDIK